MNPVTTSAAVLPRHLDRVRREWTALGEKDPFWAVFTDPDKKGNGWDPTVFFETGVTEIERVIQTAQRISPIRFMTALDFGCGVGRLSQALARRFDSVIGVDVAGSMIRVANSFNRFPGRCEYMHNVAADLAILADQSADLVYSSITLQHLVPSLSRCYIREFFRVVRPGGHVIFQLPSRPRSAARQFVRSAIPVAIANLLWRVRMRSAGAIETYVVPEADVASLVAHSGGSLLLVEANEEGPIGWESRKYFCLRNA